MLNFLCLNAFYTEISTMLLYKINAESTVESRCYVIIINKKYNCYVVFLVQINKFIIITQKINT